MVSTLSIEWSDVSGIRSLEKATRQLGPKKVRPAAARALNRAGSSGRTRTEKALRKRTGLKKKTLFKAMKPKNANASDLSYQIRAVGGDISLKHFSLGERRKGVTAAPFGKAKIFEGTFIKGGRFPNRVALNRGGHVFARTGSGRLPIDKQKSGVIIPAEMIKGESARAWQSTVANVLPDRIKHELNRLAGSAFS